MRGRETVLVVGGSAGIGLALAREFAGRGFDLVVVARGRERLEAACRKIADETGAVAEPLVLDAAGPEAPDRLAAALDGLGRRLRYAVIGLGVWQYGPAEGLTRARWTELLETGVVAHDALQKVLVPRLLPGGGILFIGSLAGLFPVPLFAGYVASKAALATFVLSLREELRSRGIRIGLLAPGIVATDFYPKSELPWLRRLVAVLASRPETVAKAGASGLIANEAVIVPGVLWRLAAIGARLVPRRVMTRVAGWAFRRAGLFEAAGRTR